MITVRSALAVLLLCFLTRATAQVPQGWLDSLGAYWARLDAEYADSTTSPLKEEDRVHFTHLAHFPFDSAYRVDAAFTKADTASPFAMKTTKTRTPMYKAHGTLRFRLNGEERTLTVYESVPPHPGYEDEVFLPFTDLTNGEETYGVGRYIDLHIPLDSIVTLDFNRAYNPYCAYNDRYSCPVPPRGNHLTTEVRAGVLKFHD